MTQFEKLLILGIADIVSIARQTPAEEIIARWTEQANKTWPRMTTEASDLPAIPQADIDAIYAAYPTKDPNNDNRRVGKSAKDKDLIRRLLENGHTKEELLDLIRQTVESGRWLKDLGTFLRNLPDFNEPAPAPQPQKKEQQYRLKW